MTLDELIVTLTELRAMHPQLGAKSVSIYFDSGYGQSDLECVWRRDDDQPVIEADSDHARQHHEHPDDRQPANS